MDRLKNRLSSERIDGAPFNIKELSHNIPGHEDVGFEVKFGTKDVEKPIKTGCAIPETDGVLANPKPSKKTLIEYALDDIEELLSLANQRMYDLPIHPVRSKAIEEIDLLNKVTVKIELRKAL